MMLTNIALPYDQIATFCQRNHIRKLSLFGSALNGDFHANSDIDLLVEFEPGYRTDLFHFAEMQDEISELVGHKVDLNTVASLSRHFRQKVVDQASVIYERKG